MCPPNAGSVGLPGGRYHKGTGPQEISMNSLLPPPPQRLQQNTLTSALERSRVPTSAPPPSSPQFLSAPACCFSLILEVTRNPRTSARTLHCTAIMMYSSVISGLLVVLLGTTTAADVNKHDRPMRGESDEDRGCIEQLGLFASIRGTKSIILLPGNRGIVSVLR